MFYHLLVHLFSLLVSYLLSFIDKHKCQILFKSFFYFGVKRCFRDRIMLPAPCDNCQLTLPNWLLKDSEGNQHA